MLPDSSAFSRWMSDEQRQSLGREFGPGAIPNTVDTTAVSGLDISSDAKRTGGAQIVGAYTKMSLGDQAPAFRRTDPVGCALETYKNHIDAIENLEMKK